MIRLQNALIDWVEALGVDHVLTNPRSVEAAQTATFATAATIPAIIRPATCEEVQQCMKIANKHHIPVYPVSKGKNWGLGSRVPTEDGCVVMDLGRLNRIVEFNEDLSFITVEPGVTFRQVSTFLRDRGSSLFLAVIGGPPESSLIGNALERGDGLGPYGDRLSNSCAMKVVLPDGECIRTGFGRFDGSACNGISRWGVGPSLDGLFSQSNLGIVTQMTFWLMKKPVHFQSFLMKIKNMDRLEGVIETMRELHAQGVLRGNSVAIWNAHKMIASERQYPWELTAGRVPLTLDAMNSLGLPWKGSEWIGVGALYSAGRQHAGADRRMTKKLLRGHVEQIVFLDGIKSQILLWLRKPLQRLTGIDFGDVIRSLYQESVFLGFPTERSTKSTYWRKKTPIPQDMDPDRDRCGVIWLCPVTPFRGADVRKAIDIATGIANRHRFEPHIAFIFPSERAVYMFPTIVYDREVPGEDERAMDCHDEIFSELLKGGYFPYRLGIHSMRKMPATADGHDRVVRRIKSALDPQQILSPGRYEFYKEAHTESAQVSEGKKYAPIENSSKSRLRMMR